jgi:hypothetical protein
MPVSGGQFVANGTFTQKRYCCRTGIGKGPSSQDAPPGHRGTDEVADHLGDTERR